MSANEGVLDPEPQSRPRTPRSVLAAGALLAVATLVSMLPERGSGTNSPSSSYGTGPTGSGAYAQLLGQFGHPVERLRGELEVPAEAGSTLVVLDAELTEEEAGRVEGFVRSGGRLVAGGVPTVGWLATMLDDLPSFAPAPVPVAVAGGEAPETEGIGTVHLIGVGSFAGAGGFQPLLVGRDGGPPVALVGDVGDGRVVLLADATPLQNWLLGMADNAGFGLAVAGPPGTPVAFAEGPHGYLSARGLAALPGRWRFALAGLGLAALVWLAARSRRLGPPEDEVRPLAPRRRVYVDAVASTLGRTGRPAEAAEPVRLRARSLLLARAGLPPDTSDDDLRPAAARLGLPPDETEALIGIHAEAGVLAAGRALARLEPGVRGGSEQTGARR